MTQGSRLKRRGARKLALDVLYENQVSGLPTEEVLLRYSSNPAFEYAAELVRGVEAHKAEIDEKLTMHSEDWPVDRMPMIDLNLLRIGTFELMYQEDVSAGTAITEAIELAKTYSTPDSSRFINGVLGKIAKLLPPERQRG